MVIDDGRILHLLDLVVKCLQSIDEDSPHAMHAYLVELKEELKRTIAEAAPQ